MGLFGKSRAEKEAEEAAKKAAEEAAKKAEEAAKKAEEAARKERQRKKEAEKKAEEAAKKAEEARKLEIAEAEFDNKYETSEDAKDLVKQLVYYFGESARLIQPDVESIKGFKSICRLCEYVGCEEVICYIGIRGWSLYDFLDYKEEKGGFFHTEGVELSPLGKHIIEKYGNEYLTKLDEVTVEFYNKFPIMKILFSQGNEKISRDQVRTMAKEEDVDPSNVLGLLDGMRDSFLVFEDGKYMVRESFQKNVAKLKAKGLLEIEEKKA